MAKTWPTDKAFKPHEFRIGLRSQVLIESSSANGSIQTSQLPGNRWIVQIILPDNVDGRETQPIIEAFFASVEGQADRYTLHHMKRPVPRGTIRGNPLSGGALRGARGLNFHGSAGETILRGDLFGIPTGAGSQLVMATADVTLDGSGIGLVTFSPPLRAASFAFNGFIVWDHPEATFISTTTEIMVGYGSGSNPGVSIELMETFP